MGALAVYPWLQVVEVQVENLSNQEEFGLVGSPELLEEGSPELLEVEDQVGSPELLEENLLVLGVAVQVGSLLLPDVALDNL